MASDASATGNGWFRDRTYRPPQPPIVSVAASDPNHSRHCGHDPQSQQGLSQAILVRAVVVTWNGAALLPACLDSLVNQTIPAGSLEILVVDNGSTDGTLKLLAEQYPDIRVLALPENLGFAGGVAAGTADLLTEGGLWVVEAEQRSGSGLETTRPQYVALLNNDARFEPDAIGQLITAINQDANTGAATALVLLDENADTGNEQVRPRGYPRTSADIPGQARNDDRAFRPPRQRGSAIINSTGNILTASGAATDRDYGLPLSELPDDPDHRQVFGFNGGAALIRIEALKQAGGFDSSLFLYYEDTDLSFRLRRAGWNIVFAPAAVAWHRHMASTGGETSPIFRYYNTRNSLIIAARYLPRRVLIKSIARQTLGLIRHTLIRDESKSVRQARRRGLTAALRLLPHEISSRKLLNSN